MKNIAMDVLSWEKFLNETSKEKSYPPKKIDLYNRLVAHTDNFFVIAAIYDIVTIGSKVNVSEIILSVNHSESMSNFSIFVT